MFGLDHNDREFLTIAALGLGFLFIVLINLRKRTWLAKEGVVAEGVVIRVECEGFQNPSCYPVVRFLTPQQKWVTARYDIGTSPASFQEGDTVKLRFDPADPTCFIIISDNSTLVLWVFALAGAGLITYGFIKYAHA